MVQYETGQQDTRQGLNGPRIGPHPLSSPALSEEAVTMQALESDDGPVNRREAARAIGAFGLQVLGVPVWEHLTHDTMSASSSPALYHFLRTTSAPISEETLHHLEKLHEVCWHLANEGQGTMVQYILPTYLPRLTVLAGQPSLYQQRIARLITRGYILAAEVEKTHLPAMQEYCKQAVIYSTLASDDAITVDALRQQATIALIAKTPLQAVHTYQQALPHVSKVSPLLQSRIYLGLASAYARCGQRQDALQYLSMALEHYPDTPGDDPAWLYLTTSSDRAALYLYEGLIYNDVGQSNNAWKALMQVDGRNPKIPVGESTRIELLNLQAKTAAVQGDLERSHLYLSTSVNIAREHGYSIWIEEAYEVYLMLKQIWPREHYIKQLAGLFMR